jgi:hypothetical protein
VKLADARSEMDGIVVGIELTLISIIQGVALTFLTLNRLARFDNERVMRQDHWR